MATGDLKNNLKKLQTAAKLIKYDKDMDYESMGKGSVSPYLPLLHYAFCDFSPQIMEKLTETGNDMYSKVDMKFIEAVYKVCRDVFSYKPPITKDQFFNTGFAEKKVIMTHDILMHVHDMHRDLNLTKSGRQANVSSSSGLSSSVSHAKSASARASSAIARSASHTSQKQKDAWQMKKPGHAHKPGAPPVVLDGSKLGSSGRRGSLDRLPSSMTGTIVNMINDGGAPLCRPIDVMAMTPARSTEAATVPGGLAQFCKILENLTDKVAHLEGRIAYLESQNQLKHVSAGADANLLARMELLENAQLIVKQQMKETGPALNTRSLFLSENTACVQDKEDHNGIKSGSVEHVSPIGTKQDETPRMSSTPKVTGIDIDQVKRIQEM